jgi:hypothetical protein
MVFPTILGTGKRLFPDPGNRADLRVTSTITAGATLIMMCEPARAG